MTRPLKSSPYFTELELFQSSKLPSEVFADPLTQHPATKQLVDVNYQKLSQHLHTQHQEYLAIQKQTHQVFNQLLDKLNEVSLLLANQFALEQSNTGVNQAKQQIHCHVDPDRSIGILNVLWHSICFFQRGNIRPMAIQPAGVSHPILMGRIIASLGDYGSDYLHQSMFDVSGNSNAHPTWLEHEVASLFVPASMNQPFYIATVSTFGKPPKWHSVDFAFALEHFTSLVLESVIQGGTLHE